MMRRDRKRLKKARSILSGILDMLTGGQTRNKRTNSQMHRRPPNLHYSKACYSLWTPKWPPRAVQCNSSIYIYLNPDPLGSTNYFALPARWQTTKSTPNLDSIEKWTLSDLAKATKFAISWSAELTTWSSNGAKSWVPQLKWNNEPPKSE